MEKRKTGLPAGRPGGKKSGRQIDIPLDNVGRRPVDGTREISDKELDFVNRHHEEYKELRRRARREGGC